MNNANEIKHATQEQTQRTTAGEYREQKPLVLPLTIEASEVVRDLRNKIGESMRFRPDMAFVVSALVLAHKGVLALPENEQNARVQALKRSVQEVAKRAYSE